MTDLCRCGCGDVRAYPVGPTKEEADLMLRLLSEYVKRRRPTPNKRTAQTLIAKIEHAVAP